MIAFKITNTPDKSQQSLYQHEGDQLILGREEGDLIIDDPSIAPRQFRVYAEAGKFYLENLDPSVEIKLIGKTIQEVLPLQGKEVITFGKTTLAFTELSLKPIMPPETYYYARSERFSTGRPEKVILDALEFLASTAKNCLNCLPPQPQVGDPAIPPPAPNVRPMPPKPPTPSTPMKIPLPKPPLPKT